MRPPTSATPSVLGALLDLLFPATCGGCGAAGTRWCLRCARRVPPPRTVRVRGLPPVVAAGPYAGPLRAALLAYKERGRRDLGAPLAAMLTAALAANESAGAVLLVPAPSRPAAARSRGGDHMRRLCRLVPGCSVAPVLRLDRGARDSVGLDPAAREANLRGRVRFDPRAWARSVPAACGSGPPVILVDDVVTTGATLRACAGTLREAGIPPAGAVVLCAAGSGSHLP